MSPNPTLHCHYTLSTYTLLASYRTDIYSSKGLVGFYISLTFMVPCFPCCLRYLPLNGTLSLWPSWTFVICLNSVHTETSFSQGLSTFKLSQCIVHPTFNISKVAFPYSLLLLGILLSFPLSSPSVKYLITTATHRSHFFLWVLYHSAILPHIKYMSTLPTWESSSLYSPWHLLWSYFLRMIPSQNLSFPVHTWYAWDS